MSDDVKNSGVAPVTKPTAQSAAGPKKPAAQSAQGESRGPIRPRTDGPSAELEARRAERLARGSTDHSHDQRLTLGGAELDFNNYQYRWVNDETGRISRLQRLEWEIVSAEEIAGLEMARHAGFSREGKAMNAVLMKKYKPWYEEDQDRKHADGRELERQLRVGKAPQQTAAYEGEDERYYTKKGFNQVTVADPGTQAPRPRAAPAGEYQP